MGLKFLISLQLFNSVLHFLFLLELPLDELV
jgi:hypothetical protein